ncbi:MAG TPA: DMT family transporter [Xanthobacteraceae bacterium]|nr:DMT family transporter [Xanthobacteraceae bacterium]
MNGAVQGARSVSIGTACGIGAAIFWACGFTAARHGIAIGLSPFDIAFHRYAWAGLVFLPGVLRSGIGNLKGIGWHRGFVLAVLGGPGQAVVSAAGFLVVPLGHGGVIQPSCAALGGVLLATLILREHLPAVRVYGAIIILVGLAVIGHEALTTIGANGLLGDFSFALAGLMFAMFGVLLRRWRIDPSRASTVLSALTLLYVPIHAAMFGFTRMVAAGWFENATQAIVQGVFSGPLAIYLFARSVTLLGASRAAVFAALVPAATLVVGFLTLGEAPSLAQVVGLAIVLVGFRLTQRA